MSAELIFGIVGAVGSGMAVISSIFGLLRRKRAERELIRRLRNYDDCRELILAAKKGVLPEEYYREFFQYLDRARGELTLPDQAMLAGGLDQESLAGRRSYVKKLVEEARESLSSTSEAPPP